jgi:hypothetical protein
MLVAVAAEFHLEQLALAVLVAAALAVLVLAPAVLAQQALEGVAEVAALEALLAVQVVQAS